MQIIINVEAETFGFKADILPSQASQTLYPKTGTNIGCFYVFNAIRCANALYGHFVSGPLAGRATRRAT